MTRALLFEIGTEELPASFVERALEAMPELAKKLLAEARLGHAEIDALGTPRRLTLRVRGLADAQTDLDEEVMGPPKSVAFGADGKPSKAGEAFASKLGKTGADLKLITTPKGDYVSVRREEKGKAAATLVPELLAKLTAQIPFQKSMRWGDGTQAAFGRPVQWLLAVHGDDHLDLSFAGVRTTKTTLGHRFLAPEAREVKNADVYIDTLREAHVLVDPAERRGAMIAALETAAQKAGATLVQDDFLVGECLSLVEEPHVVEGGFDARYLSLPEEVIVAVMRGHQRYFALRDPKTGKLLPKYLNVVNTALDPETIRKGNDRVLRARLEDASFFVGEDRKQKLETRTAKLETVVFQQKLGTIAKKYHRMRRLARALYPEPQDRAERAADAAQLSKCDLVTLVVGEFPELQGIMGRYYALADGVDPVIADAIRDHYLPKGASDVVPKEELAAIVALADRLDTLVGCFGIGLTPSGSADPFALRRQALAVVRIALEGPLDLSLRSALEAAHARYDGNAAIAKKEEVVAKLDEFFRARLRAFYGERCPGDVVDACLAAWDSGSIRDLDARIHALEAFRKLPEFESLAVAFKRAFNIAKDAKQGEPDPKLFDSAAEHALYERFHAMRKALASHVEAREYDAALGAVAKGLREPIDRFFTEVFVMAEDAAVRDNRLRLLGRIADSLRGVAHFQLLTTATTP